MDFQGCLRLIGEVYRPSAHGCKSTSKLWVYTVARGGVWACPVPFLRSAGLRSGAAGVPIASLHLDQLHIVRPEVRIDREQVHAFVLRLGDEHAVEGIAVVEG